MDVAPTLIQDIEQGVLGVTARCLEKQTELTFELATNGWSPGLRERYRALGVEIEDAFRMALELLKSRKLDN